MSVTPDTRGCLHFNDEVSTVHLSLIVESSGINWWLSCIHRAFSSCFANIQRHCLTHFLHGSLFNQFQASTLHEYFYLQGCVFCVFVLLCLIDSNMGFLNGLSSDLFPQELMTQNDFKDAWWECRSLWSETTGFVTIYPTDLNQNFKEKLKVARNADFLQRTPWGQLSFLYSVQIKALGSWGKCVPQSTPWHVPSLSYQQASGDEWISVFISSEWKWEWL